MMKQLIPNLIVENVKETLDFYRNVFGFDIVASMPEEGEVIWGMVECGVIKIMFEQRDSFVQKIPIIETQKQGGALALYIETDNLDEIYERLKRKVRIVQDMHVTAFNTKEFSVIDCNAFIIAFTQPLPKE